MQSDQAITETLQALSKFKLKSVFLYGSRGRGDATSESDYEIGVVFDDEKYVQRSEIHAAISNPKVKAYPFKWSELRDGTFSHVFQKSLYLREIVKSGRVIAGENLLEQIAPPPITTLDLIQRTRFDIGMALAALLSYRSGDMHQPFWVSKTAFGAIAFRTPLLQKAILHALKKGFPAEAITLSEDLYKQKKRLGIFKRK